MFPAPQTHTMTSANITYISCSQSCPPPHTHTQKSAPTGMTHNHGEKKKCRQNLQVSAKIPHRRSGLPPRQHRYNKTKPQQKNITKYLRSCFPHTHTHRKHKHSESLLLSEMKLTPLICSRNPNESSSTSKSPSDPPLRPQGQLLQPANPVSVSQSTSHSSLVTSL